MAPAKKAAATKAKKASTAKDVHPPFLDMIKECIAAHPEEARGGVSRPTIKKFIEDTYGLEINPSVVTNISKAITRGAESGELVLPKGLSGKVKLPAKRSRTEDIKEKENKKPVSKPAATAKEKPAAAAKEKPASAVKEKAVAKTATAPKKAAPKVSSKPATTSRLSTNGKTSTKPPTQGSTTRTSTRAVAKPAPAKEVIATKKSEASSKKTVAAAKPAPKPSGASRAATTTKAPAKAAAKPATKPAAAGKAVKKPEAKPSAKKAITGASAKASMKAKVAATKKAATSKKK